MKKVGGYIIALLSGALIVAIAAWKSMGDSYKIGINKLKQKGKGNLLENELDVNLPIKNNPGGRLGKRKNRRIEKKKLKAMRRLEKLS